jgi:uncharacterized membrane protein
MATISCPTCGRPLLSNARFCGGCGTAVGVASWPSAPAPARTAAEALATIDEGEAKGFSTGRMLKFAWRTTWDNFGPVVGVFAFALLIWIVAWVGTAVVLGAVLPDWLAGLLTALVFFLLTAGLSLGLCSVALRWCGGERGGLADLLGSFPLVLNFLAASLLYLLILTAGFFLLVFPMVVWGLSFGMYPFVMIERRLGPVEALRASARVTSGAKWDLFALSLILSYVVTIGLYAFGIGLFVAAPVAALAWAMAYRWLAQRTAPE